MLILPVSPTITLTPIPHPLQTPTSSLIPPPPPTLTSPLLPPPPPTSTLISTLPPTLTSILRHHLHFHHQRLFERHAAITAAGERFSATSKQRLIDVNSFRAIERMDSFRSLLVHNSLSFVIPNS